MHTLPRVKEGDRFMPASLTSKMESLKVRFLLPADDGRLPVLPPPMERPLRVEWAPVLRTEWALADLDMSRR